ncbi:glycosyltransferase family protein [Gracilibacillus massiliensis]|uniref:hypothetical protein n=1 Tax=Gracilibacillus massiliensis TaxID=1564956 RepID=UPI00071D44E0|nr:hypothetical protein [Gracilibacillus massiliensis]
MKKQNRMLFIIDPVDPILTIEHQLFLIHRHMSKDTIIDIKLLEDNKTFTTLLPEPVRLLPPITDRITEVIKNINQKKNWFFKVENHPIPTRIRNAYYNYPAIVEIYWKKIKSEIHHPHTYYETAISFSSGLASYYLRDKVNAGRKIYYFPIRLFSNAYQPILNRLQKNDFIYVGSQSMYSEMVANSSFNVKYYTDPFYKASLIKMRKRNHIRFQPNQQLRILSVNGPPCHRHIEAFIHLCKKLKYRNANFIWYFYGEIKSEQKIRSYMKQLNLEKNVQFIREEANLLLYLLGIDIYVEWEKQSSIYFEAELLNKPIINLKRSIKYEKQTLMNELYSILKIADQLLFVQKDNFQSFRKKYLE